ncbi:MAG TPA: nuclear transport factor 2 family protein [Stellaceae bacterium]|nr:nuclear transport factor 2 family protein [Stellaceae bacterium]
MDLDRRHLALAGAFALGGASLLRNGSAQAESGDEAAVTQAVEALRQAIFAADKDKLAALTAEQLSYGHSSAVVQNKREFVDGVLNRKGTLKSLAFPELTVALAGNAAISRHQYVAEGEQDGKPTSIKLGVLAVWQKQDGGWKLLARQGYKLS